MSDDFLSSDGTAWAFPHWGSAVDLMRLIDVEPVGDGRFRAPGRPTARNVVEGGHLLAQAIVAGAKTVPDQRVAVASLVFAKSAAFDDDVEVRVEVVRGGRRFSTLQVQTWQGGEARAAGTMLLAAPGEAIVDHSDPMPDVAGPEDAELLDMGVDGRELRVVDGAYRPRGPAGPPEIDTWCRFVDAPPSVYLHTALAAQSTTHWTLAAGLRPYEDLHEVDAHRSLSMGVMAVSAPFHRELDVTEWLLYTTRATVAAGGLVHGEGRIFDRVGHRLASYRVEAMVRPMPPDQRVDPATTM